MDNTTIQSCNVDVFFLGGLTAEFVSLFWAFLGILHLLAYLVAEDLVPVDLGAGDG